MPRTTNGELIDLFSEINTIKAVGISGGATRIEKIHNTILQKTSFLVYSRTKRYRAFNNYEDLKQEAFMGLLSAVRKLDLNVYPNFIMYADQAVRRSINKVAGKFDVVYSPNKSRVIYSDPLDTMIDQPTPDTPETIFLVKETSAKINTALGRFSNRDAEVVRRIYGLGEHRPQTLREVGSALNITYERARQIREAVVTKLRDDSELRSHTQG